MIRKHRIDTLMQKKGEKIIISSSGFSKVLRQNLVQRHPSSYIEYYSLPTLRRI